VTRKKPGDAPVKPEHDKIKKAWHDIIKKAEA
jgi:hypothetical protein